MDVVLVSIHFEYLDVRVLLRNTIQHRVEIAWKIIPEKPPSVLRHKDQMVTSVIDTMSLSSVFLLHIFQPTKGRARRQRGSTAEYRPPALRRELTELLGLTPGVYVGQQKIHLLSGSFEIPGAGIEPAT